MFTHADVTKGKMVVDHNRGLVKIRHNKNKRQNDRPKWTPPSANIAKLNVDGAFAGKGHAGCGMILRDQKGDVIYATCRQLPQCQDATEAELIAIETRPALDKSAL
jgi:hypothetical protein